MMRYTQKSGKSIRHAILVYFLIEITAAAENKWVWSGDQPNSNREERRYDFTEGNNQNNRFNRIQSRYDVTEPTTRRPDTSKPQANEFSEDFGSESPRFNFNIFGRPDQGYQNPGFIPPHHGNNLFPNPQNGILVGPGGPTGIIGRPPPNSRPPLPSPYHPLKGNPANGILVGPGGPTGIIGRPTNFPNINNNVGPQVFPTVPGINPQPRPIPSPAGYPSGIFPGGGLPPSVGAYPGGYPTGPGLIGQGLYPNQDQNYYLANFNPFRGRNNAPAYNEFEEGLVNGQSRNTQNAVNKNILKKSVR